MRDQITAMFRGSWRLELNPGPGSVHDMGLLHIITVHGAWRALTKNGRQALLDLVETPGSADWHHPLTVKALQRHGLVDENGAATAAGRAVVRHRPQSPLADSRPVVDVHLPEEALSCEESDDEPTECTACLSGDMSMEHE